MGGKKRHREDRDDYESLMKKIRKLEKKVKKKSYRKSFSPESDKSRYSVRSNSVEIFNDIPSGDDVEMAGFMEQGLSTGQPQPEITHPSTNLIDTPLPNYGTCTPERNNGTCIPARDNGSCTPTHNNDIPEEILGILGEDLSNEKSYGSDLHKVVAPRWTHILLNGLSKENRLDLLKLYLPPENCPNIKAPKLNPELKAALSDINNKKDIYCLSKQNQIASCLSAIGKALNIVLTNNNIPQDLLKPLSDAGRLLCDFHHKESIGRRYAAMNTLSKPTKDAIKNTNIDEYLFGADLAEHLKSSRAISKSGLEMRPPIAGPSGFKSKNTGTTAPQLAAVRHTPTLNARGAPRAPAAEPRANPGPRRPPPPPPPQRRYSASFRPPATTQRERYRTRRY